MFTVADNFILKCISITIIEHKKYSINIFFSFIPRGCPLDCATGKMHVYGVIITFSAIVYVSPRSFTYGEKSAKIKFDSYLTAK